MWLCWGKRDYTALQSLGLNHTALKNIGTPRSALWGPFGDNLYSQDINFKIHPVYKKFILIVSPLTGKYFYRNVETIVSLNSKNDEFDQNEIDTLISEKNLENDKYKYTIIKNTISHILAKTNDNIVIRPYGHLDMDWNELISLAPNRIFVDNKLSITPLVSASSAVLHTGSTVAIEALCQRKKTITLAGLNEDLFDSNRYSNQLSLRPVSFEELDQLLAKDENWNNEILDSVTDPGDQIFFEKFISELQKINSKIFSNKTKDIIKLPKRRIFLYELLAKIKQSSTIKFDAEKRPKVSKRQVGNMVGISLDIISNSQKQAKINKLAPSTFLIAIKRTKHLAYFNREKIT